VFSLFSICYKTQAKACGYRNWTFARASSGLEMVLTDVPIQDYDAEIAAARGYFLQSMTKNLNILAKNVKNA